MKSLHQTVRHEWQAIMFTFDWGGAMHSNCRQLRFSRQLTYTVQDISCHPSGTVPHKVTNKPVLSFFFLFFGEKKNTENTSTIKYICVKVHQPVQFHIKRLSEVITFCLPLDLAPLAINDSSTPRRLPPDPGRHCPPPRRVHPQVPHTSVGWSCWGP